MLSAIALLFSTSLEPETLSAIPSTAQKERVGRWEGEEMGAQKDGSTCKSTCRTSMTLSLTPRAHGRKEPTPGSYPLTSTLASWHVCSDTTDTTDTQQQYSVFFKKKRDLGAVVHAGNPSTHRVRGWWIFVRSEPAWSTKQVQNSQAYTEKLVLKKIKQRKTSKQTNK